MTEKMEDGPAHSVLIAGHGLDQGAEDMLVTAGLRLLRAGDRTSARDLAELAARENVDAIILRDGEIDEAVLDASARLRVVANHGVGHDTVDIAAATRRGIPVFVTHARNATSVGEQALTLILVLLKRVLPFHRAVTEGRWRGEVPLPLEHGGRTLGLVGGGSTASALATLVAPFGVPVLVYDPALADELLPMGAERVASLHALASRSDIVSLHVPLTEATRGLVDSDMLYQMRPGSILLNTSHGAVVVDDALVEALESGHLAGAGLDTFVDEPPDAASPLLKFPNVVLSPHVAGVTEEAVRRMGLSTAENTLAVLQGGRINMQDLVNPEALSSGNRKPG